MFNIIEGALDNKTFKCIYIILIHGFQYISCYIRLTGSKMFSLKSFSGSGLLAFVAFEYF